MRKQQHDIDEHITLTQATKIIPGRPSTGTVWRWARCGIDAGNGQRVALKYVRVGKRVYTKHAWLEQFFEQMAQADREAGPRQFQHRNQPQRLSVDHMIADAELRKAGM